MDRRKYVHARIFNAITRAIPHHRFIALTEREEITKAVVHELDLLEISAVSSKDDWDKIGDAFAEVGKEIVNAMESFTRGVNASSVMAQVYHGRLDEAQQLLNAMPAEELQALSAAATAVSSMADATLRTL